MTIFSKFRPIGRRRELSVCIEVSRAQRGSPATICATLVTNGGRSYREIIREQYNFSPPGTTAEREDYSVDLDVVTNLELAIIPDISGGLAHASLTQLRIA